MTSSLKITKDISEYHFLYPKLQVQILLNLAITHFSALDKILNLQSSDCELDISSGRHGYICNTDRMRWHS